MENVAHLALEGLIDGLVLLDPRFPAEGLGNDGRRIVIAIPGEIDGPAGAVITDYLTTLMNNWRRVAEGMAENSWGDANFEIFQHGGIRTVVFHEDYHAEGTAINDAYRTFAYEGGRQVQLADLMDVNAIPSLGAPYIQAALDQALSLTSPGPAVPMATTRKK